MFILSVARVVMALVSLAVLAAGGYLLWSWWEGAVVQDGAGRLLRVREEWRLWTAAGLLAWSFLGRFFTPWLLARRDLRPTRAERGEGRYMGSETGSTLYVETHGEEGRMPIVFTHGWGMDSTFWRYAAQDLSKRFRVVTWDLPGLGRSKAAGRGAISLEAYAHDLAALLQTLGEQKAIVVGHSIGGMIIQTLLRDQPQLQSRVAGAVLFNTTYTNPLKTMVLGGILTALQRPLIEPAAKLTVLLDPLMRVMKWQSYLSGSAHAAQRLGFGPYVTRSQLEHSTLLATRAPPAVEARGDLAMMGWDATGALANTRIPVLVVGGDRDIVTKLEASRAIAEQSAGASLRVIEDVNHMGPLERADLYNELVADFALQAAPAHGADIRSEPAGDGGAASWRWLDDPADPAALH
jgi:pimeloyl-ACP methyl ester carboxylesterase